MANISSANSTNVTNVTSREGDTADVPSAVGFIIIIIINTITCPFTVLLNLLVIKAVKSTPRLEGCYTTTVIVIITASYFHLILVTLERLVAVKKMKRAVLVAWILAFISGVFRVLKMSLVVRSFSVLLTLSCILFLAFAYFIMYQRNTYSTRKD